MSRPLQVLIVEDNPEDAELIVREVRRGGFEPDWRRVETEADYLAQLRPDLDVILSDYDMPEFSGIQALERLQDRGLEIPFILISGTIGEETAVATMKHGAADYLMKDRLARLGPAIGQALDQYQIRREHRAIETAMRHELEHRVVERTSELRVTVDALEAEIRKRQRIEREILEVSEREQCRLGEELHEGLGQELSGIALIAHALARQLEAGSHPLTATATGIAARISDTIESARLLAKGLYPVELNHFGLLVALENLANQASRRPGISCELSGFAGPLLLHRAAEIHVYRLVQEGIRNSIKHGRAQQIRIEVVSRGGFLTFTVADNGIGFEPPVDRHGMGLNLMEYRAEVIGAELKIFRPPEGGCRIVCRIPEVKL